MSIIFYGFVSLVLQDAAARGTSGSILASVQDSGHCPAALYITLFTAAAALYWMHADGILMIEFGSAAGLSVIFSTSGRLGYIRPV